MLLAAVPSVGVVPLQADDCRTYESRRERLSNTKLTLKSDWLSERDYFDF